MSRIHRVIAIAAVGLVAALSFSATAQAAPAHKATATVASIKSNIVHPMSAPAGCPSGDFCVWNGLNGTGTRCVTAVNNSTDWGTCKDKDITLYNHGVNDPSGFNQVRIYYFTNYGGAWACLLLGTYWNDASVAAFNFGSGLGGYNVSIIDNAESHKWATTCS